MRRVGPRMREVLAFVAENPGLAMLHAARYCAPTGKRPGGRPGIGYGYRTVHRAIRAGLVWPIRSVKGHTVRLYPLQGPLTEARKAGEVARAFAGK